MHWRGPAAAGRRTRSAGPAASSGSSLPGRRGGGGAAAPGRGPSPWAPSPWPAAAPVPLSACLQRFVQLEQLAPSESWVCAACKCRQPAMKQLTIRRLPPLLCLHVKRFEAAGRLGRKLDTPVSFPLDGLDLTPYLTASALRRR